MEHVVRLYLPGMGEKRGLKGSSANYLSHRANGRRENDPPGGVMIVPNLGRVTTVKTESDWPARTVREVRVPRTCSPESPCLSRVRAGVGSRSHIPSRESFFGQILNTHLP